MTSESTRTSQKSLCQASGAPEFIHYLQTASDLLLLIILISKCPKFYLCHSVSISYLAERTTGEIYERTNRNLEDLKTMSAQIWKKGKESFEKQE